MLLGNLLDRRTATLVRLLGLIGVGWSILGSSHPPAITHGRGQLVLIAGVIAAGSWLVWTLWSANRARITLDIWTLALTSGLLLGATPGSAASVGVFVACSVSALRVGLARAAPVVMVGVVAEAASILIYHGSGIGLLAYCLGQLAVALGASNVRQVRVRADQAELLLAQTQRSHEEQLRAARLEESARIAREIHDVLAHALAGLTIQLEATAVLVEQGVEREVVLARLQQAHQLAREGLQETRRAVGALRGDAPAIRPTIEALVNTYGVDADAPATLCINADDHALAGARGEAVLRVVQEALTNGRKHAPGAAVTVTVERERTGELLAVVEDLPTVQASVESMAGASGLAATGGGYGLRGMRERAQLLGGTLDAGPAANGWRVELRLPASAGKDGGGAGERA
jgi:signal transduction histidine kinase